MKEIGMGAYLGGEKRGERMEKWKGGKMRGRMEDNQKRRAGASRAREEKKEGKKEGD